MADRYLPLSLKALVLGQPVPVDVWSDRGVLLLQRGEVLGSEVLLRSVVTQRPMVREQTAVGDQLPPADTVAQLGQSLASLLAEGMEQTGFLERLEAVHATLKWLAQEHTDDTLFMLFQRLLQPSSTHSADHALAVAALLRLILTHWGDELEHPAETLVKTALTMNLGMHALHNQLQSQCTPPDAEQRQQIRAHPTLSAQALRRAGVEDEVGWLWLTENHHETADGTGYPSGQRVQATSLRLLQLADRFIAGLTPRANRAAQTPLAAIRNIYNAGQANHKQLGEALVKSLGFYPPGSYVRLASQETAVVVRRGQNARHPMAVAIVNDRQSTMASPVLRDTRHADFAVTGAVPPESVRVRLDPARFFQQV